MLNPYSKIVGVTFNERQQTLKELMQDAVWRSVTLIHTTFHNEETGMDEPAIQVKDFITKKDLGWIAKTEIDKFDGIYAMTAEIGEYKNTMFCNLYMPKTPTRNQYWMIKRACEKRGVKMPLYDATAYESMFTFLRNTK